MEHLLLCIELLTGIALVSLDLSAMQFPIVGFRRSRLVLGLLCRLEVCFQVITERGLYENITQLHRKHVPSQP